MWQCMPVIPVLRQEDYMFESGLGQTFNKTWPPKEKKRKEKKRKEKKRKEKKRKLNLMSSGSPP